MRLQVTAMLGVASVASAITSAFNISPGSSVSWTTSTQKSSKRELALTDALAASSHRGYSHACMEWATHATSSTALRMSVAEAEVTTTEAASESTSSGPDGTQSSVDIPTELPSDCGIDYVPLATMLATGDLKGADQFTRDALIKAAGEGSQKRDFVYWTEVKKIPNTDLATIDDLWIRYSKGKFGYSVQREVWRKTKGDFENFCRRIGWTTQDSEVERKLRWFGANEFIYDVDKAPRGHLPLTSALRGTTLLKELMQHPVWEA